MYSRGVPNECRIDQRMGICCYGYIGGAKHSILAEIQEIDKEDESRSIHRGCGFIEWQSRCTSKSYWRKWSNGGSSLETWGWKWGTITVGSSMSFFQLVRDPTKSYCCSKSDPFKWRRKKYLMRSCASFIRCMMVRILNCILGILEFDIMGEKCAFHSSLKGGLFTRSKRQFKDRGWSVFMHLGWMVFRWRSSTHIGKISKRKS